MGSDVIIYLMREDIPYGYCKIRHRSNSFYKGLLKNAIFHETRLGDITYLVTGKEFVEAMDNYSPTDDEDILDSIYFSNTIINYCKTKEIMEKDDIYISISY